jgi:hypothetical protein
LGEVISLCAVENPGSPNLPSGGESRGLEYASDNTTKAQIRMQIEEEEDEVDDITQPESVPANQQPEHAADHMEDGEVITLDASTQTYSKV